MKLYHCFLHHQLTRRIRLGADELAAPDVAVRAHVVAGQLVRPRQAADVRAGILRVAPAEAVDVVVPHGHPRPQVRGQLGQRALGKRRRGRGVHVSDRVLVAEVERVGVVLPLVQDRLEIRLVEAVDQADGAVRLQLLHVADAFAVGLPEPFLVGELALEVLHVLAGRDAETGQQADRSASVSRTLLRK